MISPPQSRIPLWVRTPPPWLLPVSLLMLVVLVYGQTIHFGFVNFDDNDYVYANPTVARGLTWSGFAWAFDGVHAANWHPLTWLSHMLDSQIYGHSSTGPHANNVLLHAATVLVLFLWLQYLTKRPGCSFAVAAIFAVHPLHVESVAWISERKDVLSGFFFFLALAAYSFYSKQSSVGRFLVVVVVYALGLLCKPMLVTLPFVLLLMDVWPLQRVVPMRKLLLEKLPLLSLSLVSALVTLTAQKNATRTGEAFSLYRRIGNSLISYFVYLRQTFWPTKLAAIYPFPTENIAPWRWLLALGGLAFLTWLCWQIRRSQPWLLFGWMWFVVMLVPVLGIVQVGNQAHADRYMYLPQIGLAIAVVYSLASIVGQERLRNTIAVLAGMIVIALTVASSGQAESWRNGETLWKQAIASVPNNEIAYYNLGTFYLEAGRSAEAIGPLQKAAELKPGYLNVHLNLGTAFLRTGSLDRAIEEYGKAAHAHPDYPRTYVDLGNALLEKGDSAGAVSNYQFALQKQPAFTEARFALGHANLIAGKWDDAKANLLIALALNPSSGQGEFDLGSVLLALNKNSEAMTHIQRGLVFAPATTTAHIALANLLLGASRVPEAIEHYRAALTLKPEDAATRNLLGYALLLTGSTDEALKELGMAEQDDPNDPSIENNLGNAFLRTSQYKQAVLHFGMSLALAPSRTDTANNLAWALATAPDPTVRDPGQAVQLAQRDVAGSGASNAIFLHTLAAAEAAATNFPGAIQADTQAHEAASRTGQGALAEQIDRELVQWKVSK